MAEYSENIHITYSESPGIFTSEYADLHGVPGPVPPLEQVPYSSPYIFPFKDGVQMTMEEAKRRFYVAAEGKDDGRLKVTRAPRPDSGIESSAELQIASSSESQRIAAAQSDENQPLLPNRDLESSMTRMERIRHGVQRLTRSWFFTPILLLLLAYPVAYLYIGGAFFEQCKNLKNYPVLFMLMGITSSVAVLTRVFRHVAVKLQKLEGSRALCTYLGLLAIILFVILYFVGIRFYFLVDNKEHEECDLFLTLARLSLWLTPLIGIVLLAIYCSLRVPGRQIV